MKKISKRAWMALALAAALLAGLLVFFGEYFIEAKTWVAFPGSPHVYTGVNPDCGKIYDRSGMLLLNTNDGRVYNADEAVRRATLHLLGDRDGYISAPLLQTYASKMIGFDVVNGLYTDEPGSVAARLTISAAVQSAAQQALSGYRGTIGVYNYKTGEILCAVTSPSYDPDHVPDVANDTTGSYEGVYVNRFFDAAYTPGSIFKLVTAAAALETIEGVQSRTFQCSGKTIIGGQEIICNGVHGSLSLAGALAQFFVYVEIISAGLAVFNVFPIPPLDGSKVLFALLSDRAYDRLMRYEKYGMGLLMALLVTGAIDRPLGAMRDWLLTWLNSLGAWGYTLPSAIF